MKRLHALVMMVLCVATFSACGQGASSATAGGSGDAVQSGADSAATKSKVYDPNAPLSTDDINLYLTVMRAAAVRVRHPTAADRAAIQRAKADEAVSAKAMQSDQAVEARINAELQSAKAAAERGDMDAARAAGDAASKTGSGLQVPAVDTDADILASEFRQGTVDSAIVQQRHIDSDRYDSIVNRIEEAVPNPYAAVGSGGGGYVMTAQQRQQEAAYEVVLAHWRQQVAPYRSQITALEKVVREPHYEH